MNSAVLIAYWAFWFFLPAGIANMAPMLASHLPGLKKWRTPIDFGINYKGRRLLGDNKTWRGIAFGTLLAGITGSIVYSVIFSAGNGKIAFLFGSVLGLGALLGDAAASFVKRWRGIAPGSSWFPVDQLDYIIGGLLFIYPFTRPPLSIVLATIAIYFGLHLLFSYIGYLVKLKPQPI